MKDAQESTVPNAVVPQAATLDDWSARQWTDGVQVDELQEFDTVVVETMHHTYEITVINPVTAEVLIRGGEMFPEKTPAFILGSSLHRSFLKIRGIYAGYSLEVHSGGKRIITSRVCSVVRQNPSRISNCSN